MPESIVLKKNLQGIFGNPNGEFAAIAIIKFCLSKPREWSCFTFEKVYNFVAESLKEHPFEILTINTYQIIFMLGFNFLKENDWINEKEKGLFYVTEIFKERCYGKYPMHVEAE